MVLNDIVKRHCMESIKILCHVEPTGQSDSKRSDGASVVSWKERKIWCHCGMGNPPWYTSSTLAEREARAAADDVEPSMHTLTPCSSDSEDYGDTGRWFSEKGCSADWADNGWMTSWHISTCFSYSTAKECSLCMFLDVRAVCMGILLVFRLTFLSSCFCYIQFSYCIYNLTLLLYLFGIFCL